LLSSRASVEHRVSWIARQTNRAVGVREIG
jgi:hypothetical protein